MKSTILRMRFIQLLNRFFIVIFILTIISVSCKKDTTTKVPNIAVNISIPIGSYVYRNLTTIGGWVYVTGGYKGIIIYRKDNETFMSYDRACPYHPTDNCSLIKVESSGLIAVDSCCGSRYYLSDGSVLKGPATVPLKSYYTTFDGNYITIAN